MRIRAAAFLLAIPLLGSTLASGAVSTQTAPAAEAPAQQDFTLVNNTGHVVTALNVSPSDERTWGPNILGKDRLRNGESAGITFPRGATQCKWDIRATYEDGSDTDMRDVNLCEVATITLTAD